MINSHENGSLDIKIMRGIAQIEFEHPASNAFVLELLNSLANQFDVLSENKKVTVILLKSKGERAFCAGASFDELVAISNLEEGKRFFSGFAHVINAMRKCPKPIIGRVQGKTVGGGVGLAAACDYVHATTAAAIKLSELAVGIGPFVIAPAVERKIGKTALAELALYPTEWKDARWSMEKGLYAQVYSSIKEMDDAIAVHLQKLSSYNQEALIQIKKVLWEGTAHWDELLYKRAAMSGQLALSKATKEALKKFKK